MKSKCGHAKNIASYHGWTKKRVVDAILRGNKYEQDHPTSAPINRFMAALYLSDLQCRDVFRKETRPVFKDAEKVVAQTMAGRGW